MFRFQCRMNFFALLVPAAAAMAQPNNAYPPADTALARQYFSQAQKFAEKAKHDSANFYFAQARTIYETLAAPHHGTGLWEKFVQCANSIGNRLLEKKNFDQAEFYLRQALQTGLRHLPENHLDLATSYHKLGTVYVQKADLDQAITNYNQALRIRRRLLGEKHIEVAKLYNNLGVVYQNRGLYDQASAFHHQALALKLQLQGENHPDVASSYINLGQVNVELGDFEKALEYVKKALAIRLQAFGENNPRVADTYLNLSNLYEMQDDHDTALDYLNKSLKLHARLAGVEHASLAGLYNNFGYIYRRKGEPEKALPHLEKSLALRQQSFGENHPEVAQSYFNIGMAHNVMGNYDKALDCYQRSLAIWKQVYGEVHRSVAEAYQVMAATANNKNDCEHAIALVQRSFAAVDSTFKSGDPYVNPVLAPAPIDRIVPNGLETKAEAFAKLYALKSHQLKDLRMALSTYRLSAEMLNAMRRGFTGEEIKLFWGEQLARIYGKAIRISFQLAAATKDPQYDEQAFVLAEHNKAATLALLLQESRAKQFAGIPASLLQKERELKSDLSFYDTEIQKAKPAKEALSRSKLRELENRYFARKREYEKLLARFEKTCPQYYALKYKTPTATAGEVQKAIDDQTAVVEYFLGDSAIYAFAVTRQNFQAFALPKDSSFSAAVAALANSFRNVSSQPEYLRYAAQIYSWLLKPMQPFISAKTKWLIIPDGELHQIPFEALLTETVSLQTPADYQTLPYLLKSREISYHYSATLFLKTLKEKRAGSHTKLFAGFAPVFAATAKNGVIYRRAPEDSSALSPADSSFLATRDGKRLEPLPYSAQEVQDILAAFPGRSRAFLQQEASEENFKQQIKDYKYVHIATHGRVVETSPKLSNLAFSQPQDNSAKEDGILYSAEMYNLDLGADLLVLSACQTGAGQIVKGEGLMGLTRGFLYSGARNIVASLWKVYDQHTSLLMVEMYRQIAAGKNYAAALREAKLKMIANPETAGPQSWAGFVLIGR